LVRCYSENKTYTAALREIDPYALVFLLFVIAF